MAFATRTVLYIYGVDAEEFLQKLFTLDIKKLPQDHVNPCALLTPQGKILFLFILMRYKQGYLIDIEAPFLESFIQRLSLYKLRSNIAVQSLPMLSCTTLEEYPPENTSSLCFFDPRFPKDTLKKSNGRSLNVYRWYIPGNCGVKENEGLKGLLQQTAIPKTLEEELRVYFGIAQMNKDFLSQQIFPFHINLDLLNGISLNKGCYIGQEVVARMYHRQAIRHRLFVLEAQTPFTKPSGALYAKGQEIGAFSSGIGRHALGILRVDKLPRILEDETSLDRGDGNIKLYTPRSITLLPGTSPIIGQPPLEP